MNAGLPRELIEVKTLGGNLLPSTVQERHSVNSTNEGLPACSEEITLFSPKPSFIESTGGLCLHANSKCFEKLKRLKFSNKWVEN